MWIIGCGQRITHYRSRVKFCGLKKNKAAQPIMKKWNAPNSRSTCCLRAELFVPNPATALTVTWPTLRKQSLQAKEFYSKCFLGINLVNRGQAWLKIAETSGYILSLIYIYSIWSLYQEFFLFVKTTEHLTNDHEKVVFLHKQIGYF